ncbi:C-type lectin domain family 4 member A-like [Oreochromis niloticus]|uniref:C-type lectin domain family 4 member A-like n=1 Tax=Oreochromis niloticus TaxID=8128 RepID=A0A669DIZ4_ORENI|nr:C-type lectin domain family 4 member A-like [Oreochromis niloticus]
MEEIYINLKPVKTIQSRSALNERGPRSSQRFPAGLILCLGLLSFFLLAGLIIVSTLYFYSTQCSAASQNVSSLINKEDMLNASLTERERTCPPGWMMSNHTCYFFSYGTGSWEKGRQDCTNREADLAIINSVNEQMLLSDFIEEDTHIWIGVTDREEEGKWKWIDGAQLSER